MKKHLLVLFIIFCSLISGGVGAYVFTQYMGSVPVETQIIEKVVEVPTKTSSMDMKNLEEVITQKVENIGPSVVSIIIKKDLIIYKSDPFGFFRQPAGTVERKVGGGTGFFILKDGTIITNKHVVNDRNAIYTVITHSGNEYDARVIAVDPLSDLAIIKIESETEFTPLTFVKDTGEIKVGQFAIAIGNALAEFQNSVSLGIVSGKERSIEGNGETLLGLIQTDTAINPGNSGGPLVNLNGKVMGINTAIINNSEGIGFSIALTKQRIDYILESIEKHGTIKRPFIGINYIPNSPGIQQELELSVDYGAYIIDEPGSVVVGSSAEKSGLAPGDIITAIDDQKVTSNNSLGDIIQNKIPGDILQLDVVKKSGETKNITLALGEL